MAVFEYKGVTADGKSVSGIVDAETFKLARAKLKKQGVFPTDLSEEGGKRKPGGAGTSALSRDVDIRKRFSRVTIEDVAVMSRQLATLVGAGIPIDQSLAALSEQVENERLKVILSQIREKVNQGISLAEAMRAHPGAFSELYINMVSAGEASGALDLVLSRLADYTESQQRLRNKLIGTLTYPVIMMMVSMGLVGFLFIKVIPKIAKLFDQMKASLPLPTRVLIASSRFTADYWWLLLIVFGGLAYVGYRWIQTQAGRRKFDGFLLRMPIFGRLFRMVAIARFASTLSALLKSGVPLLVAMKIVSKVVDNVVISEILDSARSNISEGQSVAEPLRRSGEFPPLVTHMIAIGERTGELEAMLGKVSDSYENQVDAAITALTSLLEPVMILMMGGIVAFIAVSILLPMLQLNSFIK